MSTGSASTSADRAGRRAKYAVSLAFMANGFTFASWAARIPQVRDKLQLSSGALGLLLLSLAVGSLLALPLSGLVVGHLGTRRAVTGTSLISAVGLTTIAIGYQIGTPVVAVGLVAVGLGNATWDVAMNVEGAAVEQRLDRSIMSRFHAGWSVGSVLAAVIGAGLVALHVSVTAHLLLVAVAIAVGVPLAAREFLPGSAKPPSREESATAPRNPLRAWTEPRTLLIGLFVLTAAFSEGTGNDWLGVAAIDGYSASAVAGSLTFAVFLTSMTTGRWFGPHAIDSWGRVVSLRSAAGLATAGLLLFVFAGSLPLALVGVAAWGMGTALGFPVGMSAAADDPLHAAGRVSVVASIGYTAFLAGPPVIGQLTEHVGILHSLTLAAGLMAIGCVVAGSTRPLTRPLTHPLTP